MSWFRRHTIELKNAPKPEPKQVKGRKAKPVPELKLGKTFQSILDGSILTREQMLKMLPFIFYLVFLAIIFIANTYYAERLVRRIDAGNKDLKELQIEYIDSRSKLMNSSRQSRLEEQLIGQGLKESTVPPYKISPEEDED